METDTNVVKFTEMETGVQDFRAIKRTYPDLRDDKTVQRESASGRIYLWFGEHCKLDPNEEVSLQDMYDNFKFTTNGLVTPSKKMFSIMLRDILNYDLMSGTIVIKKRGKVVYQGVKLVGGK
jgi:hypothetical protein